MRLGIAVVAITLQSAPALAQEPIVTDRPDFTESAETVPRRFLQVESGVTFQRVAELNTWSGPELLLRYGLTETLELRFGVPDYVREQAGGTALSGFSDVYAGAKLRFARPGARNQLALIPAVSLPTDGRFSSGSVDPEVKLALSRDVSDETGVGAMTTVALPRDDAGRFATLQQTLVAGRSLSERVALFVEWAGDFSARTPAAHRAHGGAYYLLTRDSQMDVHGGFHLNGAVRAPFIAAGYSARVGRRAPSASHP